MTFVKGGWVVAGIAAALFVSGCGTPEPSPSPALSASAMAPARPVGAPWFVDRASALGVSFRHQQGRKAWYIPETTGSGVALFDLDGDGESDLFFVQGSGPDDGHPPAPVPPCALYRQLGGRFAECARDAGLDLRGFGIGALAVDPDNDGYTDLLVTQYAGPTRLCRNNGDGTFSERTGSGALFTPLTFGSCGVAIDYDRDGFLDLYLGQYLDYRAEHWKPDPGVMFQKPWQCVETLLPAHYRPLPNMLLHNQADGSFDDRTAAAGVSDPKGKTMAMLATDFDGDGWPDLLVGNDADTKNRAFRNQHDGTFADVSERSFFGEVRGSMGFASAPRAPGGVREIAITHFFNPTGLYRCVGLAGRKLYFHDRGIEIGLMDSKRFVGWSVAFLDVDRDGLDDLLEIHGNVMPDSAGDPRGPMEPQPAQLYLHRPDGRYQLDPPHGADDAVPRKRVGRSAAFGDLDRDGRVDVALNNNGSDAEVWMGQGGDGAWIGFLPVGTRSPREGTGVQLTVTCGDLERTRELTSGDSYLATNARELVFGLGARTAPARVVAAWTSGRVEAFAGLAVNRYHRLVEGTGQRVIP